ncbi:MAG: DNA primase [Micromonosporaceae bacterium]
MARSPGRDSAGDATGGPEGSTDRAESTDALWSAVRVDPVEIALPAGVGFTLRAYRRSSDLDQTERAGAEDHSGFHAAAAAVAAQRRPGGEGDVDDSAAGDVDEVDQIEDADEDEFDEADFAEEEDEDEDADTADEEVPVFLGRGGRIYLFHSAEKLVEFVRSGAEHDLTQLDTWAELSRRVGAADIVPLEDDSYGLDLVVENLRGGADAWDPVMIVRAGEIARDVGYAMRLEPVITALSPGSPLDNLDEALRATQAGGVGGFLARRKLRKVAAQQAALGWRTIIGKISAIVDWRD